MGVTHTFVSAIADDATAAAAGQILPSHWNAAHTINVNLASEVSGVLPVTNGGNGTATPSLVAGSNVTVTGTWPNQTIAAAGSSPAGSTTQLQYNNAGAFGGASGLTTNGTELTIASGTKTADAPLLNATQTWNNAAITFTGAKINVTDTASNASSLLLDLQVGGTSKFNVRKDGQISLKAGANSGDISVDGAGRILISSSSTAGARIVGNLLLGSTDLALERDAANTFAQRNGTNAQTFRVYKTYTDASNYSRLAINNNQIASEVLGTGSLAITADTPLLNLAQTWNNAAVTFTGAKINVTDTASGANSLLMDLQQSGTTRFGVIKDGALYASTGVSKHFSMYANGGGFACSNFGAVLSNSSYNAIYTGYGPRFANDVTIQWSSAATITNSGGSPDLVISRKTTASLQFGGIDAAAPVAQTIGPQSVVAGTTDTAGANFTIRGSQGTGTGVGGDIIFQVASAGSTGTAQNTLAQAMRVYNTKTVAVGSAFTVATLPAAGTQGRRAWVTDASAPTFLGALTGGGTVVCPVFDNGTAWVAG